MTAQPPSIAICASDFNSLIQSGKEKDLEQEIMQKKLEEEKEEEPQGSKMSGSKEKKRKSITPKGNSSAKKAKPLKIKKKSLPGA